MLIATKSFFEPLEAWAKAVHEGDFVAAKRHALNLVQAGELLVMHPDFRRCFTRHYEGMEPRDLLIRMCQFLVCATDGRATALKQFIQDNNPLSGEDLSRPPS